jgi:signal transduction histidine kinase
VGCGIDRHRAVEPASVHGPRGVFDLLRAEYASTPGGGYIRCIVPRRSQHLLDALVPLLAAAVIVIGGVVHSGDAQPLELIVGAAAGASLAGRRRAPGITLAVSGALALLLVHLEPTAGAAAVVAPAVALYSLAVRRGTRERAVAAVTAVAAIVTAEALHGGAPTVLQTLGHVLLVAIPLLIADVHRTRHANLELLHERLAFAERTREAEAERRAEQERLRIARDLHDVVAHTLTTINVQAATAAELLDRNPAHARAALETIADASRDAIGELRAVLGVLREGAECDTPLAPAPNLDQLPDLVARARDDGVAIDLELDGEPPERLPDAVSLAAFRIAQESLTNARRHASGADVRIALAFEPQALRLVVANGAAPVAPVNGTSAGVGIMGMRERAVTIGGTLEARSIGGGFRVEAHLPYLRP